MNEAEPKRSIKSITSNSQGVRAGGSSPHISANPRRHSPVDSTSVPSLSWRRKLSIGLHPITNLACPVEFATTPVEMRTSVNYRTVL